MKLFNINWIAGAKRIVVLTLLAGAMTSSYAEGFRFVVIGDHRGITKNHKDAVKAYKAALDDGTAWRDGGINWSALRDLIAALKAEKVDFVLDVGDLISKYDPKQLTGVSSNDLLRQELSAWGALWRNESANLPIFPVRGNQEVSASIEVWLEFTRSMPGIGGLALNGPVGEEGLTYSFKYKNCIFIGIDQYMPPAANDVHILTPAAMEWLDREIRQSGHKFVFGHAPAFEIWDSTTASYYAAVKDGLPNPKGLFEPTAMATRDAFWSMLGKRQAEYFCGHEHLYGRSLALDSEDRVVRQTIIGNGGAPPPVMPPPAPYVYPAAYTLGPYAETYTGIPFPSSTGFAYELSLPRVVPEFEVSDQLLPRYDEFGYIVVEVHGSKVTATYKAESTHYDLTTQHVVGNHDWQVKASWIIDQGNGLFDK